VYTAISDREDLTFRAVDEKGDVTVQATDEDGDRWAYTETYSSREEANEKARIVEARVALGRPLLDSEWFPVMWVS
jgi:hypothetical protein